MPEDQQNLRLKILNGVAFAYIPNESLPSDSLCRCSSKSECSMTRCWKEIIRMLHSCGKREECIFWIIVDSIGLKNSESDLKLSQTDDSELELILDDVTLNPDLNEIAKFKSKN